FIAVLGVYQLLSGTLGLMTSPVVGSYRALSHTVNLLVYQTERANYSLIAERTGRRLCQSTQRMGSGLDNIAKGISGVAIGAFGFVLGDPTQGVYRIARHACHRFSSSMTSILTPI